MKRILVFLLVAAIAHTPTTLLAGGSCNAFFGKQQVHYGHVNHAYYKADLNQVYYQAAGYLREEARAEIVANKVVEKLKSEGLVVGNGVAPGVLAATSNYVVQKCGSCHGATGDRAEAAGLVSVVLDGTQPVSGDLFVRALAAVKDGQMPKGKPLTDAEKARFMEALFALAQH